MQKFSRGIQFFYGLIFFILGLNGFFNFFPTPPMSERGQSFLLSLVSTGYMMSVIKSIEVVSGLFLVFNRFPVLGVTLLTPIMFNILMFHLFLDDPAHLGVSLILSVCHVLLIWRYKSHFASLVRP